MLPPPLPTPPYHFQNRPAIRKSVAIPLEVPHEQAVKERLLIWRRHGARDGDGPREAPDGHCRGELADRGDDVGDGVVEVLF